MYTAQVYLALSLRLTCGVRASVGGVSCWYCAVHRVLYCAVASHLSLNGSREPSPRENRRGRGGYCRMGSLCRRHCLLPCNGVNAVLARAHGTEGE